MSLLAAIFIGLVMGAVFGIALEKSRVFEPGIIVGQLRLKNNMMIKVFLTAVATGAIVIALMFAFDLIKLAPKPTFYLADILGGLILGAGIAFAGACPGTVLAQLGAGYHDAFFTLTGGLVGAVAYSYALPTLKPLLLSGGPGKITLTDVTGLPYPLLASVLAIGLIFVLIALEKHRPWSKEIGKNLDGVD